MEKAKKRVERIGLVVGLFVLITAIIGLTYSFFTQILSGNENATSTTVTAGTIAVDFVTSEYINNPDMMLIKPADFFDEAETSVFTVKNGSTANLPSKYAIYLTDIVISDNFKTSELLWQLKQGDTVVATNNFASIGTNTEILIYDNAGAGVNLPLGTTHNWTFYLGLLETSNDQSDLFNGNISLKIKVVARNQ